MSSRLQYIMEVIKDLIKELEVSSFEINSDHWVDITHIDNPHHFYTRLTKYRAIVKKFETITSVLKPSNISVNDIVIFNFNGLTDTSKYARGQVQYIQNDGENLKCDLFALDYGFLKKEVHLDYIWECDHKFMNVPPLAIKCQLAYCAPKGGTDWGDGIKAFKYYIGIERARMIVLEKTSHNLIVILQNTYPDDIATLLAITDYTTFGYMHNDANNISLKSIPKTISYYKFLEFEHKATLRVRVLSGQTLKAFYVAQVSNYKDYLQECDNITYYSKKAANIDQEFLKYGDLVCVKNSLNRYDRGIIKEIHCNKVVVYLVDLGKDEVVTIMNLRKMPIQCLDMPVVAIFCTAEENQAWDNGLHRFLYPGYEFTITVIKPGSKLLSPNIVNISPLNHLDLGSKPTEKRQ